MAAVNPLPANAIINFQLFGTLNGQRIITLFQYQNTNSVDPTTEYTDYLDAFRAEVNVALNLNDRFLACMPSNYVEDFERTQPVYPSRLRFVDNFSAGGGSWASAASTSNLACSIERFSLRNGRRGIGRIQLPLPDGVYLGGKVTDHPYWTVLTALASQMKVTVVTTGPGVAANWIPVIHNLGNAQPLTSDVNGAYFKDEVRTMHRRTVGLGI